MQIPNSNILTTKFLNRVFDNTVATYKYYWFLSILDLFVKHGKTRMDVWEIMILMVVKAWYPVIYFRLSFGKSESLYEAIWALQKDFDIPINISMPDLTALLKDMVFTKKDKDVRNRLNFLQNNVPYRFLHPWIKTQNNNEILNRSQSFENGCLYKLEKQNGTMWVELNSVWLDYLKENYDILSAFAYWGLAGFVQTRNPNVPAITDKLVKVEERSSLAEQHKYWNYAMHQGLEVRCPYTGVLLGERRYDLDHFIPWSFVSHNLLWNLMPSDSSINSSKSNKLPDLNLYLPRLAVAHQEAMRIHISRGKQSKLLEDYLSLGHTPQEIISMDREHLLDCFFQTFTPMHQIALNMGFEIWKF